MSLADAVHVIFNVYQSTCKISGLHMGICLFSVPMRGAHIYGTAAVLPSSQQQMAGERRGLVGSQKRKARKESITRLDTEDARAMKGMLLPL